MSRSASMEVGPPMIGAMLRHARRRVVRDIFAALARKGFDDLREPHMAIFQYPGPEGVSPLELARRAEMSKQAMNQLLGTMERAGYLTRRVDPTHGKQRIIRLTTRGQRVIAVIRESLVEIEQDIAARLGAKRYATFVECLRELAD